MAFDVGPLVNAVARLREGLARHQSEPLDEQLRDELIRRFEFTYELPHKTLRRYLQERSPSSEEATRTSFAYAATAVAVVAEIPAFLEEVEYLCAELNKRLE